MAGLFKPSYCQLITKQCIDIMDNTNSENPVPVVGHDAQSVQPAEESDVITGLSGLVISRQDKCRYAAEMIKNVTENDLMSAKDFASVEEDLSLPDLNETIERLNNSSINTSIDESEEIGVVQHAELVGNPSREDW